MPVHSFDCECEHCINEADYAIAELAAYATGWDSAAHMYGNPAASRTAVDELFFNTYAGGYNAAIDASELPMVKPVALPVSHRCANDCECAQCRDEYVHDDRWVRE